MTTDSIATLPHVDSYFGNCPVCHKHSGLMLNIRSDHWFACHAHRTKWCAGSNLFSSWQEQDEQAWLANEYQLAGYRNVEPWFPDRTSGGHS